MKKVLITQSNYIPWKGYFDSIAATDVFVVYDDMQYTKRDWRNRNLVKTKQGLKWLTIPVEVKGKFYQKINETKIADNSWKTEHWNVIKENYKTAACYKEMGSWVEELYRNCKFEYLTEVNLYFIQHINKFLGIETEIIPSKEFSLHEEKTQRLVDICVDLMATDYYSGRAAENYMDVNKFTEKSINVHYWDYSGYPKYEQVNGDFEHGVSILDLILNCGSDSKKYMKFVK